MESMDTPKKPGIMGRLSNNKGFSLIEMAIVLVIIGIIVAAILKGQDLITNSRAKQLITAANTWKADVYAYTDRNGRFPGDFGIPAGLGAGALNKNGIIGDEVLTVAASERLAGGTAIDDIVPTLPSVPPNPVVLGGQSYWIYIGNTPATVGVRNAMVICPSVDCITPLTPSDVEIFKTLDTALDGAADAGMGQVRAITTVPSAATILSGLAAVNGRANGVAIAPVTAAVTVTGTTLPWGVGQFGAIWTFDKPY